MPKIGIDFVKFLAILFFKGDHNVLRLQPQIFVNLVKEGINTIKQYQKNYIEMNENQLYAWNWHFEEFITNNWVSWRLIFEGYGVQMTPRCPAGWDYDFVSYISLCFLTFYTCLTICLHVVIKFYVLVFILLIHMEQSIKILLKAALKSDGCPVFQGNFIFSD